MLGFFPFILSSWFCSPLVLTWSQSQMSCWLEADVTKQTIYQTCDAAGSGCHRFDLIVSEEELWEEIIVANFFCIKLQSVFPPTLFIKPNR